MGLHLVNTLKKEFKNCTTTATSRGKPLDAKIGSSFERFMLMERELKKTMQVRFLLMSLREAYKKFKEKNPSLKVGLTRFCELRPAHVKLIDQIPHQVCVCVVIMKM